MDGEKKLDREEVWEQEDLDSSKLLEEKPKMVKNLFKNIRIQRRNSP